MQRQTLFSGQISAMPKNAFPNPEDGGWGINFSIPPVWGRVPPSVLLFSSSGLRCGWC